ncbi:MAG: hypothetical protein V9G98_19090 [Candidatus Competibacter sp.]
MTTIAEQWVQEGIEKGIPMGIEKGILVGESLLLRRLLTRRFGPVPGWVEAKLAVSGTSPVGNVGGTGTGRPLVGGGICSTMTQALQPTPPFAKGGNARRPLTRHTVR